MITMEQLKKDIEENYITTIKSGNPSLTVTTVKPGAITGVMWDGKVPMRTSTQQNKHEENLEMFKQARGNHIIDIGIDENVTTITFIDYAVLEIIPAVEGLEIVENSSLSLLNGTTLSDIVIQEAASLVTKSIGKLILINEFKVKMEFDILSHRDDLGEINPYFIFNLNLKTNNAVRKQA